MPTLGPLGIGSGAMIKRVFIKGYKSFSDLDLPLSPLTVIVGANASGKSNLLDALGLLSRMATGPSIAAAYDDHRGLPLESFTMPPGGIEELMTRETLRMSLGADVELSKRAVSEAEELIQSGHNGPSDIGSNGAASGPIVERYLRYSLDLSFSTKTGHFSVESESLIALGPDGKPKREVPPFIGWDAASERLTLRSEGESPSRRYEPGQDRAIASMLAYPPHYPHATAFREELCRWRFYSLNPDAMRQDAPLMAVDSVAPDGRGLAGFYHTLKARRKNQSNMLGGSTPLGGWRSVIPTGEAIDTEITAEGKIRLVVRDSGVNYSPRVISDATMRAIGLYAIMSLDNDASLICLENPETGLHVRGEHEIGKLLEGVTFTVPPDLAQMVVTTMSPLVLDSMSVMRDSCDYETEASLLKCVRDSRETTFKRAPSSFIETTRELEFGLGDVITSEWIPWWT